MFSASPSIYYSGERAISFRFSGSFAYIRLNDVEVRCKRHQYKHVLTAAIATEF